jgi:hypothetical protein
MRGESIRLRQRAAVLGGEDRVVLAAFIPSRRRQEIKRLPSKTMRAAMRTGIHESEAWQYEHKPELKCELGQERDWQE